MLHKMTKERKTGRKQLDSRFQKMKPISHFTRPPRGWIRAIRDSLGMTAQQLAKRLGVSRPRIMALEQGEVKNSLTLQSLENAAQALGCTLVYALVPNESLEEMAHKQASKISAKRLRLTEHTMQLENQGVSQMDAEEQRKELIEHILHNETRRLWD